MGDGGRGACIMPVLSGDVDGGGDSLPFVAFAGMEKNRELRIVY